MSTTVVRVQEKGQVTIPLEIRQKLNLKKGDLVTFVVTEAALDEIGKALKERGINLEDLIEHGRETRGKIIAEEYHLSESKPS